MWDDARYWLPRVLAGQHVAVTISFAADCATVASIEPAPGARPLAAARRGDGRHRAVLVLPGRQR